MKALLASFAIGSFLLAPARAALLLYEGFNGYGSGTLVGQTTANDTGVTGTFSGTGTVTYASTGLAFGSLQTSGGAATATAGSGSTSSLSFNPNVSDTGTLWSSYLVSASAISGNVAVSTGTSANLATSAVLGGISGYSQIRYGTATGSSSAGNGSSALAINTTYLVLTEWTNVGTALGTGSSAGTAQYWVLTLAQFNSFVAAGMSSGYLTAAAIGTAANDVYASHTSISMTSGTYGFDSTTPVTLSSQNESATFDEVRYGTTLADVLPVPESPLAPLLGAAALLPLLRRRRIAQ